MYSQNSNISHLEINFYSDLFCSSETSNKLLNLKNLSNFKNNSLTRSRDLHSNEEIFVSEPHAPASNSHASSSPNSQSLELASHDFSSGQPSIFEANNLNPAASLSNPNSTSDANELRRSRRQRKQPFYLQEYHCMQVNIST
ncbi:uncharacterized protein DS421_16g566240 [Arachis hypogaea]|nr:uncharacterized protein DS421_16g566240 [Arachis hypogaea]